ncbi:MAG: hypothetical protein A4E69_00759 [Syntrophus sp. PtaB.Bin138]|nr:MAG: hypothetical protein A4E69_00759 [Syntrophus sp. PtaB.Bin138]
MIGIEIFTLGLICRGFPVGKNNAAVAIPEKFKPKFPEGRLVLVELSPADSVRDEKLLHGQIGCAFDVRDEPDQPMRFLQSGFHAVNHHDHTPEKEQNGEKIPGKNSLIKTYMPRSIQQGRQRGLKILRFFHEIRNCFSFCKICSRVDAADYQENHTRITRFGSFLYYF